MEKQTEKIELIGITEKTVVYCPQYDVEMQLCNTRWYLPQNRERLYFIGHLRGSGSRKILPLRDSLSENTTNKVDKNNKILVVHDRGRLRQTEVAQGVGANYYKGMDNHGQRSMVAELDSNGEKINVRYLTEIECERLQGYPDNWTKCGVYKGQVKEISTTQRYKLCGNGVSIPVVKEIGELLFKNLFA